MIYPVILCGGSGTRLWPMSRTGYPLHLLALLGRDSLLQQTIQRIVNREDFAAPLLVANEEHRFIIAEQLREIAIEPSALILEPVGRNTAPAACVAALTLIEVEPGALMLIMPSDQAIDDFDPVIDAVRSAVAAARGGSFVTFGIAPTRPETRYGYIRQGAEFEGVKGVFSIAEFVEKPGPEQAMEFTSSNQYLWNSGIFLFSARVYLEELRMLRPEMVEACDRALTSSRRDTDFIRLDQEAFTAISGDSIDYTVIEHTRNASVVPIDIGWSDIGSWDALWEISPKDEQANSIEGNVVAEDTQNCYLRSEAGLLAVTGIENLVVVATDDAVMVAPRNGAQQVRKLVARLRSDRRAEADEFPTVHRPWGTFTTLHYGHRVQVRHIMVKPGGKLSLQMHHHHAEHWVVIQGTAKIRRGDQEMILTEDQSTYIPMGVPYRLENPGKIPLHLIDVQSGSYLGEDDIVRFEDSYGRS